MTKKLAEASQLEAQLKTQYKKKRIFNNLKKKKKKKKMEQCQNTWLLDGTGHQKLF